VSWKNEGSKKKKGVTRGRADGGEPHARPSFGAQLGRDKG